MNLVDVLTQLIEQPGVRGALVVSREDGLVVTDALMEHVDGAAVAALTASLAARLAGVTRALGQPEPVLWQLQGTDGVVLAAPAGVELLIVAIAHPEVNAGELRLRVLRAAEEAA